MSSDIDLKRRCTCIAIIDFRNRTKYQRVPVNRQGVPVKSKKTGSTSKQRVPVKRQGVPVNREYQ